MAVDPSRAVLVLKEYRYAEAPGGAQSAAIRAVYDKAILIELNTNLDAAGAQALADDIASMATNYSRVFDVVVEDVFLPEDFIGGVPRFALAFDRHPNAGTSIYQVIDADVDYELNRTTLKVRG